MKPPGQEQGPENGTLVLVQYPTEFGTRVKGRTVAGK